MSIKVLVVDDSLFMRRLASDILDADPDIEVVDTARDSTEAIRKIRKLVPDCVTLDLVMPGQDGLTTLKHIMAECPTPVVILSAHSKHGADITVRCLEAGAVGFVLKPSGELSLDLDKVRPRLTAEVKAAAKSSVARIKSLIASTPAIGRRPRAASTKIIVIGASTGGPQTLRVILSSLPVNFPVPVIVVQHAPTGLFTQSLAERLDENCCLVVKVAEHNETIRPGVVYLAPGGSQMMLVSRPKSRPPRGKARPSQVVISLMQAEPDALTPSVDITMQSVGGLYGGNAVGIVLTGMGHDGVAGMKAIKRWGGKTIAQDESSLIFGMPKAVIDAGCADKVLPVGKIAQAMADAVADDETGDRPGKTPQRRVGTPVHTGAQVAEAG